MAGLTSTHSHAHDERPGHHWREADRVQDFVARMDKGAGARRRQFDLMVRLIPYEREAAIRVLDIGAGFGAVASAVLGAFPNARADLLDVSEEMIRVGEERMAQFGGRHRYVNGSFAEGRMPDGVADQYDAIVSSAAIHHLPSDLMRAFYREIAQRLAPGGCFLDIDIVGAPDAELEALYRRIERQEREAAAERRGDAAPSAPAEQTKTADRHEHTEPQPLASHLEWLREAGLEHVDCFWKHLSGALFGGFRPKAG